MSRSLRRLFAGGAAAGFTVLALPALGQEDQPQPMQRVEVTGSSIKRLASETSLPITTLRAGDFAKQGLTTAQDVLNTIPMNQSSQGSSQSVNGGSGGRAVDGTYVNKYEYQNERGGPFTQNAGRYADATPVFRWRHNLLLSWGSGDWTVNLANRYNSHYIDQNNVDPEFVRSVKHWSMWTLSGSYSGNKNVDFTAGVKNLLDQDPPYSNQSTNFQQGYDPRYTDPLGATVFMRATYKF